MREAFHSELTALGDELAAMCVLASTAITRATRALVEVDLALAEQVIAHDAEVDQRSRRCEDHAFALLALQAPVAGDLRVVVTAIRAAERLERMGDLARHVAELARRRYPDSVLPAELVPRFVLMGRLATEASRRVEEALEAPTGDRLPEQDRADDAIDELQDAVLDEVRAAEPPYPVQVGIDVALLTRYYERFADQAVGVVRNLDYSVTGKMPV